MAIVERTDVFDFKIILAEDEFVSLKLEANKRCIELEELFQQMIEHDLDLLLDRY